MSVDDLLSEFIQKKPNSKEPKDQKEPEETGKPKKEITMEKLEEILHNIKTSDFSLDDIDIEITSAGYDLTEEYLTKILQDMAGNGIIYGQGENIFSFVEPKLDTTTKLDTADDPLAELLIQPKTKTNIFEDTSVVKTVETKNQDTFELEEMLGVKTQETSITTTDILSEKEQKSLAVIPEKELQEYKKARLMVWTPDNIPKQFIMMFTGFDKKTGKEVSSPHILKAGLLWLGSQVGVKEIIPEPIINTWDDNNKEGKAVYKCTIITIDGKKATSYRAAIPDGKNVKNRTMYDFIDAFAETRAICSALRLITNCGFIAAEELPEYDGPLN